MLTVAFFEVPKHFSIFFGKTFEAILKGLGATATSTDRLRIIIYNIVIYLLYLPIILCQITKRCIMVWFRVLTDVGLRSASMWHVRGRQLSGKSVRLELFRLWKVFGVMMQLVHRHHDQRIRFDGATATGAGHNVRFGGHTVNNGRQWVLPQRFCGKI